MTQFWVPAQRADVVALLDDPARAAAARSAASRVDGTRTVGLGSGRAVWATMELLARRDELRGLSVVTASTATERLADRYGFRVTALDGDRRPDLYLDGADEVAPDLGLLKGHGNALLREKLLAVAARRFVVVAEASKCVARLGQRRTLPLEVVAFAWADTRRRLAERLGEVIVRTMGEQLLVTDEGNHVFEVQIPDDADPVALATTLNATVGVVEHGLFLDLADEVLIGSDDGDVEVLTRRDVRLPEAGLRP